LAQERSAIRPARDTSRLDASERNERRRDARAGRSESRRGLRCHRECRRRNRPAGSRS
jgi:hypothetical protein